MSTCCEEYASDDFTMLELVFAPCTPQAGADRNWIAATDDEIIEENEDVDPAYVEIFLRG